MTNRDKPNELSTEEFANRLHGCCHCLYNNMTPCTGECLDGFKAWLESEVDE